jgi:predicted ribosomally synthesized peptide with nif11-like leader
MPNDQLKAFLDAVKTDPTLQEKIKAAANTESVAAIANDAGYMISAKELQSAQPEISDDELERAVGAGRTEHCTVLFCTLHCGFLLLIQFLPLPLTQLPNLI